MGVSKYKLNSKIITFLVILVLLFLMLLSNVISLPSDGGYGNECATDNDCGLGFRCSPGGQCIEIVELYLAVAASKDSMLLTDTNQFIKADVTDPNGVIKSVKVYVDNILKKSCDVPAEGPTCKFDFLVSDFSTAAHTYYAEAFDVAATSLIRDPTTGTKSFTITNSPGQLIDTRIKSGTTTVAYPARGGSFAVESYILSSATLPSRSKYWILYIDGTEKKRCTDDFVPKHIKYYSVSNL